MVYGGEDVTYGWGLFVIEFTGFQKSVSWRTAALLGVEPLGVMISTFTNGSHNLFWTTIETTF
ncbi:histidine kinase N-terminal 7TM domain-containing protein [Halorientalis salina]|uniref:histidine kinase N-terminal 7TM domain-containing protein n=1 Tax=Halorientalis salina TaxID=2932266 RepID=UPI0010ABC69A